MIGLRANHCFHFEGKTPSGQQYFHFIANFSHCFSGFKTTWTDEKEAQKNRPSDLQGIECSKIMLKRDEKVQYRILGRQYDEV